MASRAVSRHRPDEAAPAALWAAQRILLPARPLNAPAPLSAPADDDFGATNAWAVFACLGLYPVTATGLYVLSSPCFANTTLQLPAAAAAHAGYAHAGDAGGAAVPLVNIVAHNFSVANVYVARATLNGAPLATPFVSHSQLLPPLRAPRPGEDAAAHAEALAARAGPALLEFFLTDEPGLVWGAQ